ncbi:MAG: hypothetical protein KKA19_07895 [Candidatus Margulisbacteria bacterium]|nr:hypothetical protein [Candidatus Margulisiibacteriota bacterium]
MESYFREGSTIINKKFPEENLEEELEKIGFNDDEIHLILNSAESEPEVLNGWVNFGRCKFGFFEMLAWNNKYFLFTEDKKKEGRYYGIG